MRSVFRAAAAAAISLTGMSGASLAAPQEPLSWVTVTSGDVPAQAIQGGVYAGRPLPVCRAGYRNGGHPGRVVSGKCSIAWDGEEVRLDRYQVLVGDNAAVQWRKGAGGLPPQNVFVGGTERSDDSMRPLPVCRGRHHGGLHPGKFVAGRCLIGFEGHAVETRSYEFLVLVRQADDEKKAASASNDLRAERYGSILTADLKATDDMLRRIEMLTDHDRLMVPNGTKRSLLIIVRELVEQGEVTRAAIGKARTEPDFITIQQQGQRIRETVAKSLAVTYVFGRMQVISKARGGMTEQEFASMTRGLWAIADIYKAAVSNGRPVSRVPGAQGKYQSTADMARALDTVLHMTESNAARLETMRRTWVNEIKALLDAIRTERDRSILRIGQISG